MSLYGIYISRECTYKNSLLMSLLCDIYQQGVTVELLILSLYAHIYQQGVTYKELLTHVPLC